MCGVCIDRVKAMGGHRGSKCPFCNVEGVNFVQTNKYLLDFIKSLNYKCSNHENGCDFIGELEEIISHENAKCKERGR